MRYDKEQLERFINDTINHREPSEADKQAAADALIYAMSGNDLQEQLGLKRKTRGKILEPQYVSIDSPLFEIVRRLVAGDLKYKDAVRLFRDTAQQMGYNIDWRTSERRIEKIRPRAKQTHETLMAMMAAAKRDDS